MASVTLQSFTHVTDQFSATTPPTDTTGANLYMVLVAFNVAVSGNPMITPPTINDTSGNVYTVVWPGNCPTFFFPQISLYIYYCDKPITNAANQFFLTAVDPLTDYDMTVIGLAYTYSSDLQFSDIIGSGLSAGFAYTMPAPMTPYTLPIAGPAFYDTDIYYQLFLNIACYKIVGLAAPASDTHIIGPSPYTVVDQIADGVFQTGMNVYAAPLQNPGTNIPNGDGLITYDWECSALSIWNPTMGAYFLPLKFLPVDVPPAAIAPAYITPGYPIPISLCLCTPQPKCDCIDPRTNLLVGKVTNYGNN
jgi:hypothetical protein